MSQLPCVADGCQGFAMLMADCRIDGGHLCCKCWQSEHADYQCDVCGRVELGEAMTGRHSIHKAKLDHLEKLINDNGKFLCASVSNIV